MFEFKCWHDDYGDKYCCRSYYADSAAKAKVQHYQYLHDEMGWGKFFEVVRDMKCKKSKVADARIFFGDVDLFERMKESRNIGFAYQGMTVLACGKRGTIVGANGSHNLDVVFDNEFKVSNVHPFWEITYLAKDGTVVKEYKKGI